MAQGFAFVSHDGEKDGVRAEVYVQKGTAKISRISPHDNGKVAQVEIKTEGLKFPQKAWVNVTSELFAIATKAYDSGEEVEYRIESQRHAKEDRTTPIAEFRASAAIAQEKTKSILAGLNGVLNLDEAVTDPAEDPSSGGRVSAITQNQNKAAAAPAPAPVASSARNARAGNGGEAPAWALANDDGSRNLGSYHLQSASGVEIFVRNQLKNSGWHTDDTNFTQEVYGYAAALLKIADSLQGFFTRKPANRMANSHTRLRGVIFDTVEHFLPFSLIREGAETKESWYRKVGGTVQSRFSAIMELDFPTQQFDVDAFLGIKPKEAPAAAPLSDNEAMAVRPQRNTEQSSGSIQQVQQVQQQEAVPEEIPAAVNEEAALANLKNISKNDFAIFPQNIVGEYQGETDETIVSALAELVSEGQIEMKQFGSLLRYTFGQHLVKNIDPELLGDFMDFYLSEEVESPGNLKKVVAHIEKIG